MIRACYFEVMLYNKEGGKIKMVKTIEKKTKSNDVKVKYHIYRLAKAKADVKFHEKRLKELSK